MNEEVITFQETKPEKQQPSSEADMEWPEFTSEKERQKWIASLPREEANVDERLKKRIAVEFKLHRLMVEGFDYLAKKQNIKNGKELMYIALSQYLSKNLPEDF